MDIDLGRLREMHQALPLSRAADLIHCAAVGLERNRHLPGVSLAIHLNTRRQDGTMKWTIAGTAAIPQLDFNRVT